MNLCTTCRKLGAIFIYVYIIILVVCTWLILQQNNDGAVPCMQHVCGLYSYLSVEISLVSNSSDAVELSSDALSNDSTVTYESGEFHWNNGTDSLVAWTNEHGPPTPKETIDNENECLCHEKMILGCIASRSCFWSHAGLLYYFFKIIK